MRNVVFLVKNGIGFGHIRRALLLAERLEQQRGQLRPIVISQAHTLDIYRSSAVRVVNFPLLHRVPSAVLEDCYLDILNKLMTRLAPGVVVEDTYPDHRYGAVPALRGVPRILIMRRLDGLSLDQLRERKALARYSRILIAQTREEFLAEGHSGDTIAGADLSNRVEFIGNVHYVPPTDAIDRARQRYCPEGEPLVVVSAGAGGDQLHDGYGDRLFGRALASADALRRHGHPAKFLLVTGPYYAGRAIPERGNVVVRRFEPDLPALLAAADVAVIKPGNNALSEALVGSANLVLVPDASFMEGVREHAERVVATYGGEVIAPSQDSLDQAISTALRQPRRAARPETSAAPIRRALDVIAEEAGAPTPRLGAKQLTLLVRDNDGVQVASSSAARRAWPTLTRPDEPSLSIAVLVGAAPPTASPQALVERGAKVLFLPDGDPSGTVRRWLKLTPTRPSLLAIDATAIEPAGHRIDEPAQCISGSLASRASIAVVLDLQHLPRADGDAVLTKLLDWLADQPVELVEPTVLASHAADELMGVNG
ncbi:MAG: hypothetical protein ACRDSE_04275 [Pseudonocardiaceae bacterium]